MLLANLLLGAALTAASDEILSLPGLSDDVCFKQYAGYVPVAEGSKHLYYWFTGATTEADSADTPVLLWLNGGPGCSSLGGMFTELGPFVVDEHKNVSLNEYAWNSVAHVLYMEQPAGVGFSYPAGPTNDSVTASDTYDGLLAFFRRHPEYRANKFFVAGESYGGHYVPNIVKEVVDRNEALPADSSDRINIAGFAVGNGYTDWAQDFKAPVPYGLYHGLTSPAAFEEAMEACKGDVVPCFWPRPGFECTAACGAAVQNATAGAMDGSIDIYDIYADVCLEGQEREASQAFVMERERRNAINRMRASSGRLAATPISPIFPTCIEPFMGQYLNDPAVQAAIHAKVGAKWAMCGLEGLYDFNFESVLPLYQQWAKDKKLQMLVYNGDADYIVNFLGTENWLEELGLEVLEPWTKWTGSDGQVAGFVTQYDGLAFATVKGAGHMVPKDRPRHALDMITAFLQGTPLAKVPRSAPKPLCA